MLIGSKHTASPGATVSHDDTFMEIHRECPFGRTWLPGTGVNEQRLLLVPTRPERAPSSLGRSSVPGPAAWAVEWAWGPIHFSAGHLRWVHVPTPGGSPQSGSCPRRKMKHWKVPSVWTSALRGKSLCSQEISVFHTHQIRLRVERQREQNHHS